LLRRLLAICKDVPEELLGLAPLAGFFLFMALAEHSFNVDVINWFALPSQPLLDMPESEDRWRRCDIRFDREKEPPLLVIWILGNRKNGSRGGNESDTALRPIERRSFRVLAHVHDR